MIRFQVNTKRKTPGIYRAFLLALDLMPYHFWNCDMRTMMNVQTNVRSIAPMIIQATTFVPTFCLFVLLIYFPSLLS